MSRNAMLLCVLLCATIFAATTEFSPNVALIEKIFDHHVGTEQLRKDAGITSIMTMVVANNNILFHKGYGMINKDMKDTVPDLNTIYNIGSVSKTFIGTVTGQLLNAGNFSLQTQVESVLPNLIRDKIIGNYDSSMHEPQFVTKQPISVFNLMTHTAGFDERYYGLSASSESTIVPLEQWIYRDLPPRIRDAGIVSTYSNHGSALLALVNQKIAGKEYETLLQDGVLNPLRMNSTYYGFKDELWKNPNFARPIVEDEEVQQWSQYLNGAPAGAIYSSAQDMSQYMITHLNNGYNPNLGVRILDDAIAKQMHSEQFNNRKGVLGVGLVWQQNMAHGVPYYYHDGVLPPYFTQCLLFPEQNVGLLFFYTGTGNGLYSLHDMTTKFVLGTMVNTTNFCADGTYMNNQCVLQRNLSSISNPSPTYASRLASYAGCYFGFRYPHASWLKIILAGLHPICFTVNNDTLRTGENMILYEVEENLFQIGQIVQGIVYVSKSAPATATFVFDSTSTKEPRYYVVNGTPFERRISVNWTAIIAILVVGLGIMLLLSSCFCISWLCVLDGKNLRNYTRHLTNSAVTNEIQDSLGFDEDTSLLSRKDSQSALHQNVKQDKMIAIVPLLTLMWLILIFVINFITCLHLLLLSPMANALGTGPVPTGLAIVHTMPLVSMSLLILTIALSVIVIVIRYLKRDLFGNVFTLLMVVAICLVTCVNVSYFVVCAYFNMLGPFYLA